MNIIKMPNELIDFKLCKNISMNTILQFLRSQGYNCGEFTCDVVQSNSISSYLTTHNFHFNKSTNERLYGVNHLLILTNDSYSKPIEINCNNNPDVRYIIFSIDDFKVLKVIEDENSTTLTTIFEKDLTKEWIQFLSINQKDYKKNLINLCRIRKEQAIKDLEEATKMHEKAKQELDYNLLKEIGRTEGKVLNLCEKAKWAEEIVTLD